MKRRLQKTASLLALVAGGAHLCWADDWLQPLHVCIAKNDFACARKLVDAQLDQNSNDATALIWSARLTSWAGDYSGAGRLYGRALAVSPNNAEALVGLIDVQLWSGKPSAALATIRLAEAAHVAEGELIPRREKALAAVVAGTELRSDQSVTETRHEVRIGSQIDRFNFASQAYGEEVSLMSRWSPHWSTRFAGTFNQRFGEAARQASAGFTFRATPHYWFTGETAFANSQDVVARHQLGFELGTARALPLPMVKGYELYVQQHNFWFTSAHVTTFGATNLFYLPHDWMLTIGATAARTDTTAADVAWEPSGFSKILFPFTKSVSAELMYAVGAENYSVADQIGHIATRSVGGGMRFKINGGQDIFVDLMSQDRSQGKSQLTVGASYGLHF